MERFNWKIHAKGYKDFADELGYNPKEVKKVLEKVHREYVKELLDYGTKGLNYTKVFTVRPDSVRVNRFSKALDKGRPNFKERFFKNFNFDKYRDILKKAKKRRSELIGYDRIKWIKEKIARGKQV